MRISTKLMALSLCILAFAVHPQRTLGGPRQAEGEAAAAQQIEPLQSRVRELIAQLDEIEELHEEPTRGKLVRRHWQAVQDYLRAVRELLPPAPPGSLQSIALNGSAAGCRLATTMDAGAYVTRMRDLLWKMREQLVPIRQAHDPAQRLSLLSRHVVDTYHGLQLVRGYGWMNGAAAPVEVKDQPVPDSASTPAYLVRYYCGQCHAPPPPELHSANEWSGVAAKMVAHMGVAEVGNPQELLVPRQREMAILLSYLEANGCETE